MRRGSSAKIIAIFVLVACAEGSRGEDPVMDRLWYPCGIALDPAGDTLWVVSTNFDMRYRNGTVIPIELGEIEKGFVGAEPDTPGGPPVVRLSEHRPSGAVAIGSFGGDIAIGAENGVGVAGYVTVRDGDALQWFTIGRDAQGPIPSCGVGEGVVSCDADHTTSLAWIDKTGKEEAILARDPFGLALSKDPSPVESLLYVSSLLDGTFAVLTLDDEWRPSLASVLRLSRGLYSIVEGPRSGNSRVVYISNRMTYVIHVVEVRKENASVTITTRESILMDNVSSSGDYFRGLALSPDMRRLFAAYRSPSSVVVFDIDQTYKPVLRGMVPLAGAPSAIAVDPRSRPGAEVVYAVDFGSDAVYVVDIGTMSVMERITVGDGPYGIAIGRLKSGVMRAFVTLFEEHGVSIIDMEPESPTFHKEIVRIK